jgi:hypothetical protein
MSMISTHLRNFKEPSKDQLTQIFFSIPSLEGSANPPSEEETLEINAVLSLGVQGEEESYVSADDYNRVLVHLSHMYSEQAGKLHLIPPYLAFSSLDRKSVRFTIPLSTIRRVERLNARAGVYALSLSLWHTSKIVRVHPRPE